MAPLAPRLAPGLSQRQTLAPRLSESLRLLALPTLDLAQALERALETNPLLERLEGAEEAEPLDALESAGEADGLEAWERLDWSSTPSGGEPPETAEDPEPAAGLRQHLIGQLALERFSDRDYAIALVIVDALDDDGYLREPLAALLAELSGLEPAATEAEIEAVLQRVQRLDPPGVAARSPGECLLVQLAAHPEGTAGLVLARHLLSAHFAALARGDPVALARLTGADPAETGAALALIRGLDPHPGYRIGPAQTQYLVPELIARREEGGWRVEPNPAAAPRLQVNETYTAWLAAHRRNKGAQTLSSQLEEARWLVRSLAQREQTLLRVGTALVRRQAGFLEHGPEKQVPLALRDIAEELELHESTISRAVQGKALAAPRGIIPLRHFFSSAVSKSGGDAFAARAVQQRLRTLIDAENPAAPLSDAALATALAADGIRIARRTVAKYREALGLASARERKRPGARRSPAHESS